jgi:ligand-binding SRPBCC domain-containing protein
LYAFHANPYNLPLITPPNIKVEVIKLDKPIQEGVQGVLKIKKGLIAFVWGFVFEKVTPQLIIDRSLRSPFKSFVHEHHFISIEDSRTKLIDRVTFEPPLAPLSNPIAWFVRYDMKNMFIYRHQKTLEYFSDSVFASL